MAKKITRQTLEQLATSFAALSKEEQHTYIGGGIIVVDCNGAVISDNSILSKISAYQQMSDESDKTYWVVYDPKRGGSTPFATNGSISNKSTADPNVCFDGYPITDISGTAVTKELLAYLAERTKVEWGAMIDSTGNRGGRLYSSGLSMAVYRPSDLQGGYDLSYHTHPFFDPHSETEPSYKLSESDRDLAEEDAKKGVKKSAYYDAESNQWVVYQGSAEKGEVQYGFHRTSPAGLSEDW